MAVLKAIANVNAMHKKQIHLFRIIMVFNLLPPFRTNFRYKYREIHM